jgi:hypothetical protein
MRNNFNVTARQVEMIFHRVLISHVCRPIDKLPFVIKYICRWARREHSASGRQHNSVNHASCLKRASSLNAAIFLHLEIVDRLQRLWRAS